jgi:hypothetical protein
VIATIYLVVIAAFGGVDRRSRSSRSRSPCSWHRLLGADRRLGRAHGDEVSFIAIFRFVILPMFLFSGLLPDRDLPAPLEVLVPDAVWRRELCRTG